MKAQAAFEAKTAAAFKAKMQMRKVRRGHQWCTCFRNCSNRSVLS